jgi:predicted regulator of Ras-like GTPase activity (Roadblock/LC7/MglB family)
MDIGEILKELNRNNHVKGSLVITQEGITVASALGIGKKADAFAAFCSSVCLSLLKLLKNLKIETFFRYILSAEDSKLFIVNIGKLYLVVITDIDVELSEMNVELYRIESLIRKTGRLE